MPNAEKGASYRALADLEDDRSYEEEDPDFKEDSFEEEEQDFDEEESDFGDEEDSFEEEEQDFDAVGGVPEGLDEDPDENPLDTRGQEATDLVNNLYAEILKFLGK